VDPERASSCSVVKFWKIVAYAGQNVTCQRARRLPGVDPLTDAEEPEPAEPLKTGPKGKKPNATSTVISGTGEIVKDRTGKEAKRVV
jgi:hypothetical protein